MMPSYANPFRSMSFIPMPPKIKAYGYNQDNGHADDDDFYKLNRGSIIGFLHVESLREK